MVGLSIVLENQKSGSSSNQKSPQVINKATMNMNNNKFSSSSSSSQSNFPVPTFLQRCFLCQQPLLPSKDIYMYKGESAFCSVECRCRQIFNEEEDSIKKENCSLAAMKPASSSSASGSRRKGNKNRGGGGGSGFAY
ncbi:FCS-Like Zinc finger 15-like [Mangifera indica]|uniref:FCS-Like Zinc finger 15-like n=1 Tax=Mangifera indica TaxID=29780 RepID=UPI001CFB1946|nr:FCS-Like Zinc finger 15-like [Mangifera indica]